MFDGKINQILLMSHRHKRFTVDIFTLEFAENEFLACPGIVRNDVPDRLEEGLLRQGGHLESSAAGEHRCRRSVRHQNPAVPV